MLWEWCYLRWLLCAVHDSDKWISAVRCPHLHCLGTWEAGNGASQGGGGDRGVTVVIQLWWLFKENVIISYCQICVLNLVTPAQGPWWANRFSWNKATPPILLHFHSLPPLSIIIFLSCLWIVSLSVYPRPLHATIPIQILIWIGMVAEWTVSSLNMTLGNRIACLWLKERSTIMSWEEQKHKTKKKTNKNTNGYHYCKVYLH